MSLEILEKVKEFFIRLVKDESFRAQLMSDKVEKVKKIMTDGGYNFSQDEFEKATIKILELKELGEFHELSEEELVGAVGGLRYAWPPKEYPTHPPYPRPYPKPRPNDPQPLYGIIVDPLDPPVQALYGVVVSNDEQIIK
ncbi:Nif11-like leader peptide family natural product precursor [Scytonema sp. UIC 10036]|uniref:Nif11 family protein n=1 Tax=Scytonema sp. UIC 10036 TaxID=2304196 RepID=UPI0012DA209C|nr:Nif11 family protein [Scytonema sp. UIC 10036]MUG93683.1 Nif11-like leader peptide family natural product precursor [Scytonema sp. UIC 10036]